jgi:hypothetical protein
MDGTASARIAGTAESTVPEGAHRGPSVQTERQSGRTEARKLEDRTTPSRRDSPRQFPLRPCNCRPNASQTNPPQQSCKARIRAQQVRSRVDS